jgi:hypothetical protein
VCVCVCVCTPRRGEMGSGSNGNDASRPIVNLAEETDMQKGWTIGENMNSSKGAKAQLRRTILDAKKQGVSNGQCRHKQKLCLHTYRQPEQRGCKGSKYVPQSRGTCPAHWSQGVLKLVK